MEPRGSTRCLRCRGCDLSVPGTAQPAGVRTDPARKGQGLFHRSWHRPEFCRRSRRRGCGQAGRRGQRTARRHRRRRTDHGPAERRAHQDRRHVRRQGLHAARGSRGFRHYQAQRPQGQDHLRHVVPGHDLLRAARIAGERRAQAGGREHPVRRPERGLGVRRHRQGRGHGRGPGLDPARSGSRRAGQGDPDRRVLSPHGAGHRGIRSGPQGPSPSSCASSSRRRCAA